MATSDADLKYLVGYGLDAIEEEPEFPETKETPPPCDNKELWWPNIYPKTMEFFNSYTKYCLVYGERYSSKSWTSGHKAIRHAWENWDALVVFVSFSIFGTSGGIWEDVEKFILPEWEENIGLKWVGPRQDQAKNSYIKVANRYGGWSTLMMKSIPHGSVIDQRFKQIRPSMIVFDEITETEDESYFTKLAQQLGRRKFIKHQQFIATCNPPPQGEDHWVYRRWFKEPEKEEDKGTWQKNYAKWHFPMSQNVNANDLDGYLANLKDLVRDDPSAYARLVEGRWVKQMTGIGIFKEYWMPRIHIKGGMDGSNRRQLIAFPGHPITAGYDLGKTNQGIVFQQFVPIPKRTAEGGTEYEFGWIVLDELVTVGKKIPFHVLVEMILEKQNTVVQTAALRHNMDYEQAKKSLRYEHISDSSSWNFDPGSGLDEHELIAELSKAEFEKNRHKYPYLSGPIVMQATPKGANSIMWRVRQLIEKLQREQIYVDAGCKNVIDMFVNITAKKDSIFEPESRNQYKHCLDALTYPHFFYQTFGPPTSGPDDRPKPIVY